MNRIQSLTRRIKQTTTIIGGLFLLFSCTSRLDLPSYNQDGVPDGMVRLTITPNLAPSVAIATRSTTASANDKELSGVIRVLVLDSNNPTTALLTQPPAAGTFDAGTGKLTVLLNEESEERYLCVMANLSNADVSYLSALTGTESLSSIATRLRFSLPTTSPFHLQFPLTMSGWSEKTTLIKSTNPTDLNKTVTFQRSVARIDINGIAANFTVHGASLSSAPRYGYTLPQPVLPIFGITEVSTHGEVTNTPVSPTMQDLLFCFESKGNIDGVDDRSTRVIIKGSRQGASSPSYYPIDIIYPDPLDPTNPTPKMVADIKRNTIYTINLSTVAKDGYRTIEEAAQSEAYNTQLEMDIVVTDPFAHDITTNGKQYLGVTNSEFVIYPLNDQRVTNLHIASVSYTCDPGWSVGSITLPAGMTFSETGSPIGRLEVSHSTVLQDIVATIPAGFTSGSIVLHIGDLRKEIAVRRMSPTPPTGGVFSDYFTSPNQLNEYKVGEIIVPSAASEWLKVSRSAEIGIGGSSLNNQIINPEGGIYIHAAPNAGFETSSTSRESSLYVAGERDNQRIKVHVQQDFFDLYSGIKQILPYSYVGTFHRWNETAERLIRIYAPADSLGGIGANEADLWWQADVVAGREFIVLDTELPHANSGTTIWNGTSVNWTGAGDKPTSDYASGQSLETAPGAQLDSKLRSVRKEGTSNIYFRVGLTGKLASPSAAPRYGLITITAGIKGKVTYTKHNIYVRQGEAADYLMRPWDPSTKRPSDGTFDFRSPVRPLARKFTPYNLTHIGTDPTIAYVKEGKNNYGFVNYPSQGGYFFRHSGVYAIRPNVSGQLNIPELPSELPPFNVKDAPWSSEWETCPKGYRRPNDGEGRLYADFNTTPSDPSAKGEIRYPNDIINSEMRQSIWLYPRHGGFKSDFSNQLRGFLADGYFDRREISKSNKRNEYAIVNKESVEAAYRGYLVFNPINYASLFIPLAGSYDGFKGGTIQNKGDDAIIHTSTPGDNNSDGWTLQALFNITLERKDWVFDMYTKASEYDGYSIRCIKDELPLIGTESGNTTLDNVDTSTPSLLAIRHIYNQTDARTLQQQIESAYTPSIRQRINSIAISGDKPLSDTDYAYLNDWCNNEAYNLRHLTIRGKGNTTIPPNAFTGNRWSHVQLFDARNIQSGAFAASATTMRNLSLMYIDDITVASDAFGFATTNVQLHLLKSGIEYGAANKEAKTWKSKTWSAIKGE